MYKNGKKDKPNWQTWHQFCNCRFVQWEKICVVFQSLQTTKTSSLQSSRLPISKRILILWINVLYFDRKTFLFSTSVKIKKNFHSLPGIQKTGCKFFPQMTILKLKLITCSVVTDKHITCSYVALTKLHNSLSARCNFDKGTLWTGNESLRDKPRTSQWGGLLKQEAGSVLRYKQPWLSQRCEQPTVHAYDTNASSKFIFLALVVALADAL